jgi:uncharacterized membrane protein YozB (DUF420 family)
MSGAWPAFNASLNATSAVLLALGLLSIRRGRLQTHAGFMVGACTVSVVFLVSYVCYHLEVGSVRFTGTGWIRPVYFTVLISHTILAIAIVPFVVRTLVLAGRRQFDAHKALARWTLPLWFYVSVSGVIVYGMLYHL